MSKMQSSIIPISLVATGMLLLSLGGDSLKVAAAGIRFLPVQWLAGATLLSYRTVGYLLSVLGCALMLLAAEICRRHDNRVVAASPGMAPPHSLRIALLGGVLALLLWAIASDWLLT